MTGSLAAQSSAPDHACACTHVSLISKVFFFFGFSIATAPSFEELGLML